MDEIKKKQIISFCTDIVQFYSDNDLPTEDVQAIIDYLESGSTNHNPEEDDPDSYFKEFMEDPDKFHMKYCKHIIID